MTSKFLQFWTGVAILLTVISWLVTFNRPFVGDRDSDAWEHAHMALMARSFAQEGVFRLGGVPIQNNPPLGTQPDTYVHWPPLFAILMGMAFRVFGESVATANSFALFINVLYFLAFVLLAKHTYGKDVAVLSLFGLLVLPAFVLHGSFPWTVNAGVTAIMLALYCFLRATVSVLDWRWIWAGAIAVAIGTLLSWEPLLLGFVLLGLAIWRRSKPRMIAAATYAAAGLASMSLILLAFMTSSPELRSDLGATIRYRMGGTFRAASIPIHALVDSMYYIDQPTKKELLLGGIDRLYLVGGSLGVLAVAALLLATWDKRNQRNDLVFTVGALLGVWVGWFVIFPNHAYGHEYQWLLAAPLFGLAFGAGLDDLHSRLTGPLLCLVAVVVPVMLLGTLVQNTIRAIDSRHQSSLELEYAKDVYENTGASSVVLSPFATMVPVYYSQRHVIRYVADDETLRLVNRQVWTVFPGSDVFLALRPKDAGRFPCALSQFATVKETSNVVLLKVLRDVCS